MPGAERPETRCVRGRMTIVPGATDDPEVIKRAVAGCDGSPRCAGSARSARVLDGHRAGSARSRASRGATRVLLRLAHHPRRQGRVLAEAQGHREVRRPLARLTRFADLDDQVEAAGGSSPATHGGLSCAGATSKKARARAYLSGAATSATPSLRATSRAAWTSPCSWWRRSRTMNSSTRLRLSSADSRPRRLLTRTRRLADAVTPPPRGCSGVGACCG